MTPLIIASSFANTLLLWIIAGVVICTSSSSSAAAAASVEIRDEDLILSINSRNDGSNYDNDDLLLWMDDNFPIVAAADADDALNVSSSPSFQSCVNDTRMQLAALRDALPWAVQMYESSGSLSDKLMIESETGNVRHEMGLFDECLAVSTASSFQAKYCTVFFDSSSNESASIVTSDKRQVRTVENMSNFVKPSVAFCIPSSCTADDLCSAVAHRLRHRRRSLLAPYLLLPITSEDFCYTPHKIKEDKTLTTGAIIFCCIISLLILLTLVATIHDLFKGHHKPPPMIILNKRRIVVDILYCFSARKNSLALLSTKAAVDDHRGKGCNDNQLSCLYGIRFICMFLLIAFHSQYKFTSNINNFATAMKNSSRWDVQYLTNGTLFVDAFFLMSGLLVCLSLMRQLDRSKGSFNVLRYYLHRYVRLTPLYAFVMASVAFILPLANTGPDWHYIKTMAEATRQRLWWGQLLYINNYVPTFDVGWISPQSGMIETWYLACDMQMYWLSPLFIYPLWRWKKVGLVWVLVCLSTLLAASTIPFIQHPDLLPTLLVNRPTRGAVEVMGKYWNSFYTQTYCRLPPYIIGILLGWLLHKTSSSSKGQSSSSSSTTTTLQLNKFSVAAGWTISIVAVLICIHGMAPFFDRDSFNVAMPNFSPMMRIGFGAFHRSAFALAVAWIIFACTRQYGGVMNRVLSWKVFMPLGRLCYSAYLINLNVIKVSTFSQRSPSYMSDTNFILAFLGFLLATFLLSFATSLLIEMPFLKLDKLLLPGGNNSSSTDHHQHHNNNTNQVTMKLISGGGGGGCDAIINNRAMDNNNDNGTTSLHCQAAAAVNGDDDDL